MTQTPEKWNGTPRTIIPATVSELPIKPATGTMNDFDAEIQKLIPTAGTLDLSEEERQILYNPINESNIEIRPDGLIYLPWIEYMTRLRDAFGLNWTMIPQGLPKLNGNHVLWGFYLIIRGKLCGFSIGEQEYQPDNKRMSWSDACEGTKSNALMRLCKGLGMCMDLWKPSFVNDWKEKYAESYWDQKKNKYLWRKKPVTSVRVQHTEIVASGKLPYKEAYERFSRQPERYTEAGGEAKPSGNNGNGKTSPEELMEKIQNTATLEDLRDVWKTYYHYMEAFPPEDKDNILVAKDRRKQEFIAKNERGFFNGRK